MVGCAANNPGKRALLVLKNIVLSIAVLFTGVQALATSYGPQEPIPSFNPQGYVFTLAGGSGEAGYADGSGAAALFNNPQVCQSFGFISPGRSFSHSMGRSTP